MNLASALFLVVSALGLLVLPRRWAPLSLIAGACYVTLNQAFQIGPLTFTVIRILIAVAAVRVVIRGERLAGGMNALDKLMVVWAIWACISSAFHNDPADALVFRVGMVYNACGMYFILRALCQSMDDVVRLCVLTALLLTPVAIEMVYEKMGFGNLFGILGGLSGQLRIRDDEIRAYGPFAHSILAGTVGAVSLPLMVGIWREHRLTALLGLGVCVTMIMTSASSGPIMSGVAGVVALSMWRYRKHMRTLRWLAVVAYIALDLVMKAPAYYLIGRVDLTGSSTGWHRARLIESSFDHLGEWWLAGTDYTRHWMTTGVSWSADHTDITNHYIHMGVVGGLPMMLLFIAVLGVGFAFVGAGLREPATTPTRQFMLWALGASLFTHAATFISVSYFDQSFVFIYLTLGAIASARSAVAVAGASTCVNTTVPVSALVGTISRSQPRLLKRFDAHA